jgi:hypothetical protein
VPPEGEVQCSGAVCTVIGGGGGDDPDGGSARSDEGCSVAFGLPTTSGTVVLFGLALVGMALRRRS